MLEILEKPNFKNCMSEIHTMSVKKADRLVHLYFIVFKLIENMLPLDEKKRRIFD